MYEKITSFLWPQNNWGRARSVAVALTTVYVVNKIISNYNKKNKFLASKFNAPPNQVILHQFKRGKTCPNLSPFALKVESFLRLSGIPYTADSTVPFGPKGKCPWVNLEDGKAIGDSQFIVDTLTSQEKAKTSDCRLPPADASLSDKEKASLAGMVALVEDQLFWCVIYYRYYLDSCKIFLTTQDFSPMLHYTFPLFMKRGIRHKCEMQGIGVHSPEEVLSIARTVCKNLNDYLGSNSFFCGSNPGTADCAIFGGLSQIMWNAPGTEYEALLTKEFPMLAEYCNRMKNRVYPDWDQLLIS